MKFRMYIDEVGNSDLKSSSNPNHRFLSLTGVILELENVKNIVHPQMEEIKNKFFESHPDEPLIFHRKELVNYKHPFEILRDETVRSQFDNELLTCFEQWNYTVITVCLDKQNHCETYQVWRYDPYHYCLALLLERFTFFLEQFGAHGDVLAESRGGKEDRRLKDSFANLWDEGTEYITPERIQDVLTSKQLKVKPKKNNISGLQLADLIAHPSRNEILNEAGLLERDIAPFAAKIIEILQQKYYANAGNVFGKKFL